MTPEIHFISSEDCIPLRAEVLRPGLPLSESEFPCDEIAETFHLGALLDEDIVGIATFFPEAYSKISAKNPYRLRGMAVDPEIHRQGIGRKLIAKGLEVLRERKVDLLWFNARKDAFAFYESLGFVFATEMFDIPGVGPHKVMCQKLT